MLIVSIRFLHKKAVEVILTDDDMVFQFDVHQHACLTKLVREEDVVLTWPRCSRRMVVQDYDRSGIVKERLTHDGSAVDSCRVQCAL